MMKLIRAVGTIGRKAREILKFHRMAIKEDIWFSFIGYMRGVEIRNGKNKGHYIVYYGNDKKPHYYHRVTIVEKSDKRFYDCG